MQLPDSSREAFIKKQIPAIYKADTASARKEIYSSIQILSKPLQALVYKCAGFEEGRLKQFSTALKAQQRSYDLYNSLKQVDKRTEVIIDIVRVYIAAEEMDSAVKILLVELKKVPGDVRNEAILLSKTGVILKETKNTDKCNQ